MSAGLLFLTFLSLCSLLVKKEVVVFIAIIILGLTFIGIPLFLYWLTKDTTINTGTIIDKYFRDKF